MRALDVGIESARIADMPRLDPARYTALSVPRLLKADPWEGFFEVNQTLTSDMRRAAQK